MWQEVEHRHTRDVSKYLERGKLSRWEYYSEMVCRDERMPKGRDASGDIPPASDGGSDSEAVRAPFLKVTHPPQRVCCSQYGKEGDGRVFFYQRRRLSVWTGGSPPQRRQCVSLRAPGLPWGGGRAQSQIDGAEWRPERDGAGRGAPSSPA